jgi:transcriptional regulator with PAS, ATPase and Fis domain
MKHSPEALAALLEAHGPVEVLEVLADLLPGVAVVVTDLDRHVLFWSHEAERMFGHRADTVVGGPCPDGVVCDAGRERPWGAPVRVRRADGGEVRIRHYARVWREAGPGAGAVHVLALDGSPAEAPAGPALSDVVEFHGLRTRDPQMFRVLQTVRNVAETDVTVLLRGESGTGKELVARAIHEESRRRKGPFVAVNCAAFTPTLLESELFGHTKGAFTGAVSGRKGIFLAADGGTLFLDEVAELPLDTQAKLLRVLEERVVQPVGSNESIGVDVRVIAATHKGLREEVRLGRFRADLMYRLRVVPIFLPPLRDRRVDVDVLVQHFLAELNRRGPRQVVGVAPDAMRELLDHPWPGNVRELHNVLEYAFAVGRGPEITLDDLPPEFHEGQPRTAARALSEAEQVREALLTTGGDLGKAAEKLGVSRTTFWRMRRRAGLD